jgi:hypothetical protein
MQLARAANRGLLVGRLSQCTVDADLPPEWHGAAEVALSLTLIRLHVSDPLANAITFGLGDSRQKW